MTNLPLPLRDVATALALLTRLPVRARFDRTARAAWAWPLAGVPVALMAGGFGAAALWLGTGPNVAAGLILAAQILVTGALHEDGLADCADGFWGGFDSARRLDIMRDSQIGTYGVLALVLSVGLRWAALAALAGLGTSQLLGVLATAALLSRAAMLSVAAGLTHARADGLSHTTGRPPKSTAALGCALALALTLGLSGFAALPALAFAAVSALGAAALARRKIGGQTGDVLGATQQLAECALLVTLMATIA